ncbi:hypothetical protein Tco_0457553 [Tanacetum coccineum]
MPFPRFTKVIINHFLSQHKSLSNLKFQHYHTIKDDGIESRLKFIRIGEDYQEYGLPIPDTMLNETIIQSESYQMFLKYSTESEPEPAKKKTVSRRLRGVVIRDTPSALKPKLATSKIKLKGISSFTPEEQEVVDTMQALKERKKTNRRQLGTRGSSEGTGRIPGVPDESTFISTTSHEGTRPENESEHSDDSQLNFDDKEKKDKDRDSDDEGNDHISDTHDTDNEEADTKSDEDEIYKYKIRVRKDVDV